MMTPLRPLQLRRPGWAWLLWLALLALPLAQAAGHMHSMSHGMSYGMSHGMSHTGAAAAAATDNTDKQASQLAHCEHCLGAAALGTAASAGPNTLALHAALRQPAPGRSRAGPWIAPPPRAYRSRAPPHAPH